MTHPSERSVSSSCNTCREALNLAGFCTNKQCSRHGRTNDYLKSEPPPSSSGLSMNALRALHRKMTQAQEQHEAHPDSADAMNTADACTGDFWAALKSLVASQKSPAASAGPSSLVPRACIILDAQNEVWSLYYGDDETKRTARINRAKELNESTGSGEISARQPFRVVSLYSAEDVTSCLSALESEVAQSERDTLQVIDERDRFEDQITAIYHALGGTNEWSNLHDLGEEALELAESRPARRKRPRSSLPENPQ